MKDLASRRLGLRPHNLRSRSSPILPLGDLALRGAKWISTPPSSTIRPQNPDQAGRRRRLVIAARLRKRGVAHRPTGLDMTQAPPR